MHREYYPQENDSDSAFTFPGYQTQPTTYDPAAPCFAGADHVGSLTLQKETVCLGLRSGGYLSIATSHSSLIPPPRPALSRVPVELPRTQPQIGQMEAALPGDSLMVQHVAGHSGELWSEFCDAAAKYSSTTTHWLPRQDINLCSWKDIIPHLCVHSTPTSRGLPTLGHRGFYAVPPRLPDADCPVAEKYLLLSSNLQFCRSASSQPECKLCMERSTIPA